MKMTKILPIALLAAMLINCSYKPCSINQHAPDNRSLPADMAAAIDIPAGGYMCIVTDSPKNEYTRSFEYPNDSAKEVSLKWLKMLKGKGWSVTRSDSDEYTNELRVQKGSAQFSLTVSKVADYNWTTISFQSN